MAKVDVLGKYEPVGDRDLLSPSFRNGAWAEIVSSPPRDLTETELNGALPLQSCRGSVANTVRFARKRILNILGFTINGASIK